MGPSPLITPSPGCRRTPRRQAGQAALVLLALRSLQQLLARALEGSQQAGRGILLPSPSPCAAQREGSTGKRWRPAPGPALPPLGQQPEPAPAGRGSARCPHRDLALRGRSTLFSGQVSGLLPGQGMAQPVLLLFLRRRSRLGGLAGFGRGICTLRRWLCPGGGGGQPSWGRARARSRRLSLGMGPGGCGECGASPARLSGGRGREQVLIFVLEAQPVSAALPGGGGAGCCWGGLLGAWFSLAVYAIFCEEPTSRQRGGVEGRASSLS